MSLINDHDLLVLEPTVFVGAAAIATALISVTDAAVSDTTLTSASADFQAADIGEDHVALLADKSVEILDRVQATELEISLPRVSKDDPAIGPGDGSSLSFKVLTFERLIGQVQDSVLRAAGIDPHDPIHPMDESAILNPEAVGQLIATQVVAIAFAAASALTPDDASLAARATLFSHRLAQIMHVTSIVVDLNGDGQPDAVRRLDVVNLIRI